MGGGFPSTVEVIGENMDDINVVFEAVNVVMIIDCLFLRADRDSNGVLGVGKLLVDLIEQLHVVLLVGGALRPLPVDHDAVKAVVGQECLDGTSECLTICFVFGDG